DTADWQQLSCFSNFSKHYEAIVVNSPGKCVIPTNCLTPTCRTAGRLIGSSSVRHHLPPAIVTFRIYTFCLGRRLCSVPGFAHRLFEALIYVHVERIYRMVRDQSSTWY